MTNFGYFIPMPLIGLKIEPQSFSDVDLPTDEGLTEEAIARIRAALLNAGFLLVSVENLGIGDK